MLAKYFEGMAGGAHLNPPFKLEEFCYNYKCKLSMIRSSGAKEVMAKVWFRANPVLNVGFGRFEGTWTNIEQ